MSNRPSSPPSLVKLCLDQLRYDDDELVPDSCYEAHTTEVAYDNARSRYSYRLPSNTYSVCQGLRPTFEAVPLVRGLLIDAFDI